MKRASSSDDSSPKRIKHTSHDALADNDSDPFAGLERNAIDLFHNGSDDTGHLCGRFFMAWKPIKNRLRAILEIPSQKHSFDVEFTGVCAEFFDILQIKPHDDVVLALKGARVEKVLNPSRTCTLSMKLQYADGVIIKFGKHKGASQMVNTWRLKESAHVRRNDDDEWFSTPSNTLPNSSPMNADTGTADETVSLPADPPPSPCEVGGSESRLSQLVSAGLTTAEPHQQLPSTDISVVQPDLPNQDLPLTKRQLRQLKKAQRKRESAASITTPGPPSTASVPSAEPIRDERSEQASSSSLPLPPSLSPNLDVISEHLEVPATPESPATLSAGLVTDTDTYRPLKTLVAGTIVNLIAVTTSITSPSSTRSGDLMCNITVVDPSNVSDNMMSTAEGFKINCFTKKYAQWLPQPNLGEVLILRNVKISNFNFGVNGVGYYDKLQWAIYSPSTGKIRYGDLGDAPESECLAGGFGHNITPFFQPGTREIRREAMGEVHQIGGDGVEISSFSRSPRKHRLICEAGPDAPPQGYFDCTVEVLHKFLNDNNVLSLYVTDYTGSVSMGPTAGAWCSTRLADLVFKIEVWDDAVRDAMDMQEGDFYSIQNVRARVSRGGYVEGKLVEPKTCRLEVADASYDVQLRALLARKKAWQEINENDTYDQFEHRLIKDVVEGKHFNCVVEVLHVACGGKSSTYIYVTDYTSRAELFPNSVKESWGRSLEGRILKIQLCDEQVDRAKSLEPGAYYKIKNLRLKNSVVQGQLVGRLGSEEILIQMLDPNNQENNELKELIRRREKWKEGILDRDRKPMNSLSQNCTTIARLQESAKCPNKFRIRARVIEFDPLDLVDAMILYCVNCKKDIPSGRRACIDCADTDHEYVRYLYQMHFLLQDDDGQTLPISVNDQCHFFQGLSRTDIRADSAAYRALKDRVSPILGNLMQVHEDMKNGIEMAPDTPPLTLIIYSWEVDGQDGERAYALWEIE